MSRSDSNPDLPRFDPALLREHGTADRVDRGWERLERELTLSADSTATAPKATRRTRSRTSTLAAALVAGFALGVGAYGFLDEDVDRGAVVVAPAPVGSNTPEVMAAGSAPRSYALPGGGVITLEPGTIIDRVVDEQGEVRLRLVRGEATVTRGVHDARRLAVMVGDAEVVPAGGRTRVRHDGDTALFKVLDGSAAVRSGDDGTERVLGPDQEARLPTSKATASLNEPPRHSHPAVVAVTDGDDDDDGEPTDEEPVSAPTVRAEWMIACDNADYEAAAELHLAEGGDLSAVDPQYLLCLNSGHRARGDQQAAVAALEQIVAIPGHDPSGNKLAAALDLASIYNRLGDTEKARKYNKLAQELSGGRMLLSAERMCEKIKQAAAEGRAADFEKLREDYRQVYPDGACIPIIAQLEAQLEAQRAAQQKARAEAEAASEAGTAASDDAGDDVYGDPESSDSAPGDE